MNSNVLITGGAGFIGFHLAKYLAERGDAITIVDNLSRGKMDPLFQELIARKQVRYFERDLTLQESFKDFCEPFDHVYHLAAINGTRFFYERPDQVLKVNILTALYVLEWFLLSKSKKIIFSSSGETYAGGFKHLSLPIPTPEDIPLCIENIHNERWSYGGSKIAGELLFMNYARVYGFDMTIVRFHNIYGPRMGFEHVIPEFLQRIYQKTDPFPIYGNTTRSFCYVEDAVRALYCVMQNKNCNGKIVNIGNDAEEIQMVDLAKIVFELLHYNATIKLHASPQGSVERRCPDITTLKTLTGFQPEIALREGILKTHAYYRHPPYWTK